MHKYGVVYLNRGNDLTLVCCNRYVQNVNQFHRPTSLQKLNADIPYNFFLLKHWKELERGDFAPSSRFGAKSSRESKPK